MALPADPTFTDLRAALNKTEPVTEPVVEVTPPVVETPVITEPPVVVEPTPVVVPDKKPKRFSELTRRIEELEAENSRLKPVTPPPAPAPIEVKPLEGKPVPPDASKFTGTWEELEAARSKYTEDYASWAVKDALNKQEVAKSQAEQAQRADAVNRTWKEQYEAAVEEDEAVIPAVKKIAPVLGKLGLAEVVKESSVAVKIVMELSADAAKMEAITKMSLASAAREIGRIEAAVLAKQAAPVVVKPALPAPPAVVGGGAAGGAPGIDMSKLGDLPMDQFRKVMASRTKGRTHLSVRQGTIG